MHTICSNSKVYAFLGFAERGHGGRKPVLRNPIVLNAGEYLWTKTISRLTCVSCSVVCVCSVLTCVSIKTSPFIACTFSSPCPFSIVTLLLTTLLSKPIKLNCERSGARGTSSSSIVSQSRSIELSLVVWCEIPRSANGSVALLLAKGSEYWWVAKGSSSLLNACVVNVCFSKSVSTLKKSPVGDVGSEVIVAKGSKTST